MTDRAPAVTIASTAGQAMATIYAQVTHYPAWVVTLCGILTLIAPSIVPILADALREKIRAGSRDRADLAAVRAELAELRKWLAQHAAHPAPGGPPPIPAAKPE